MFDEEMVPCLEEEGVVVAVKLRNDEKVVVGGKEEF
uniref:Uncharacterized protein n=1 Tax=Rhizophora mucronata TaxID=61149 RepID=A0A2P2NXZ4_RHIMU